jgi:hypothetical protein
MILLKSTPTQEVAPISIKGELSFYCCGYQHLVKLTEEWKLRCPRCHELFHFTISPINDPSEEEVFKPGLTAKVLAATEVTAGSVPVKLVKGSEVLIAFDPYNVIPVQLDEVLIEVKFTGQSGNMNLVAPIKKSLLELVTHG